MSDFDPDAYLASQQQAASPTAAPEASKTEDFDPDAYLQKAQGSAQSTDDFDPDSYIKENAQGEYGTTGQQIVTGLEGAGRGLISSPGVALVEKGLNAIGVPGTAPEDQDARQAANPWTSGLSEAASFGASMFAGTGEAALLAKAGEAVEGLSAAGKAASAMKEAQAGVKLAMEGGDAAVQASALAQVAKAKAAMDAVPLATKLGTAAARGATEMALLQTGNETTKLINDAPTSVSTALTNIGLSAAFGGLTGGMFSGVGLGVKKGLELVPEEGGAFVNRLRSLTQGLSPEDDLHQELTNIHKTLGDMEDASWGDHGIKLEAIDKILPEANDTMKEHVGELFDKMTDQFAKMDENPGKFPQWKVNELKEQFLEAKNKAMNAGSTSQDMFRSLNEIKQTLGGVSKHGARLSPLSPESNLAEYSRSIEGEIRKSLERPDIWGDAGQVQKDFNAAFTKMKPFKQQFNTAFMGKVGTEPEVLMKKVTGYLKEGNNATSDTLRQKQLGGFMKQFKNYQKAIGNATEKAGIENPIAGVSTNAIDQSLKQLSAGAKMADAFYNKNMTEAGSRLLGGAIGAGIGSYIEDKTGIHNLGYGGLMLGGAVGAGVLPSIMQPLLEKALNASALQKSLDYGQAVMRGEKNMNNTVEKVFKAGAQPNFHYVLPDDKKLDKLDKQIDHVNQKPSAMRDATQGLDHYMPAQSTEMMGTIGRASQYFASIKPKATQMNPFDKKVDPDKFAMREYRNQLSIAEQPLQLMQKVKDGTIKTNDIKTLMAVHPALYPVMQTKLLTELTNHLESGGTVPYTTRQSLSLFMGHALDSTLSPESIIAAQSVFAPKQPPQAQGNANGKGKGAASKLGKSNNSYKTASQAAESDRSSRD